MIKMTPSLKPIEKQKIEGGKKELICFQCLPPKPMKDHKSLNGVVIHEREDCPPDTLYMVNGDLFKKDNKLTEQYKCPSYYDDNNVLQDCTCGRCPLNMKLLREERERLAVQFYEIIGEPMENEMEWRTYIEKEYATVTSEPKLIDNALWWLAGKQRKMLKNLLSRLEERKLDSLVE